jgi:hypothetical protein
VKVKSPLLAAAAAAPVAPWAASNPLGAQDPPAGWAALGEAGTAHPLDTFAGSITMAVWPLGCSIRLNVLPFAVSMSEFLATSTARRIRYKVYNFKVYNYKIYKSQSL